MIRSILLDSTASRRNDKSQRKFSSHWMLANNSCPKSLFYFFFLQFFIGILQHANLLLDAMEFVYFGLLSFLNNNFNLHSRLFYIVIYFNCFNSSAQHLNQLILEEYGKCNAQTDALVKCFHFTTCHFISGPMQE